MWLRLKRASLVTSKKFLAVSALPCYLSLIEGVWRRWKPIIFYVRDLLRAATVNALCALELLSE